MGLHEHDHAFVEAERMNILSTVLHPTTTATLRETLMVTAVQMLEDALSTVGDFQFTVDVPTSSKKKTRNEPSTIPERKNRLRREDSTYELDSDHISVHVPRNKNRLNAMSKISKNADFGLRENACAIYQTKLSAPIANLLYEKTHLISHTYSKV